MPKFFKSGFGADSAYLEGDAAHHICRSLRMREGERLSVSDLRGTVYECALREVSGERVLLDILSSRPDEAEPNIEVTLFQCVPKGDKMETVVQKAVELGVTRIVPVLSCRCVSRPDPKSAAKKQERLSRIAQEAAGQSGRGILPAVEEQISFAELLSRIPSYDSTLLFYEGGGAPVGELVRGKRIALLVGPEGGFDPAEVQAVLAAGGSAASLGPRILRTETAPLAALAAVMYCTGNLQ